MSDTFADHFSIAASRYADFRPHYPAALFDYLASIVPRNSLVWDCAAGNGQATPDLARRFDRVVATDASEAQVGSARPLPNIEWRVARAEASGLPDSSVGLITVAQALHWFDLDCFYTEVRRVLRPGGVLAVWAYGVNTVGDAAVNRQILDYYANIVGPYWPPERRLVEEGYRTIPFPFRELPAPAFHMEAKWTLEQLLGYISTWSATNRYLKATGDNPLIPLAESLGKLWKEPEIPQSITWPLAVRLGRVES